MTTIQNIDVQEWRVGNVTILMIVAREDVGDAGNLDREVKIRTRVPPQEETGMTANVLGQDSTENARENTVHSS